MNDLQPLTTMILAAGLGTRMRPLTLENPKPLLCVGGKPLIVWHIEALQRAGVQRIVINTAYLGHKLVDYLHDGSAWGVSIVWSHEQEPLETAGGIVQALPLLGKQPFILVNGDVWTNYPRTQLVERAIAMQQTAVLGHLVLVDNPAHHPQGDFYLSSHSPYLVHTHAQQDSTCLTFAGLSVLHPALFEHLPQGKAPLAPLLRAAMQAGRITGEKLTGDWVDVGTIERLTALDNDLQTARITTA